MSNTCLPTFIIGGAPRSGTTFLAHVLDQHPDVYIAKPIVPEPKVCLKPCTEGIDGYRQRYHELFSDVTTQRALGEKSSAYFENQDALTRLQAVFEGHDIRFIFIVREPVKRAFSNYLRSYQNGLEKLSFSEAIEQETQRDDPFPLEMSYVRPFDYLTRGYYAAFAERYIRAFGHDHVKFLLFEDLYLRPDHFYRDAQHFIQVDPLPRSVLELPPINATESSAMTLDPFLEKNLRDRMRPDIEKFAVLTGLDIGVWGYE